MGFEIKPQVLLCPPALADAAKTIIEQEAAKTFNVAYDSKYLTNNSDWYVLDQSYIKTNGTVVMGDYSRDEDEQASRSLDQIVDDVIKEMDV